MPPRVPGWKVAAMPPIPQSLIQLPMTYLSAFLALAVALAGGLLCRGKSKSGVLPAIGAAACLAGWAALVPFASLPREAWSPRAGPELLLLPAVGAVLAVLAAARLGGRLERWGPALLAILAGWWIASSPVARPEFWRVWFFTGLLAWLLSRLIAGQSGRGLASGLALWGGSVLAGAPAGWAGAALVLAAAWAGLLPAEAGAVPSALVAATIAGADLASGRLLHGGLDLTDCVCLGACVAPMLTQPIANRFGKRLGGAVNLLAAAVAAVLTVAFAWILYRALRP